MPLAGDIILATDVQALLDPWVAFTPVWTASTVNPVLGNGTLQGRKKIVGTTMDFVIGLTAGTTTTFGTGSWFFALPNNAYQPGHPLNERYIGQWRGWDNSVPAGRQGTVMLAGAAVIHPHTIADPAINVNGTTPLAWATSDRFTIVGRVELA